MKTLTVILTAAIALIAAPAAHADPDQFLRDVAAEGFTHQRGPNAMLSSGYQTCADLDNGMSIEAVTLKDLMPMTNMTSYEKARVLDLMIMDLCPAHTEKYHSWLNGG